MRKCIYFMIWVSMGTFSAYGQDSLSLETAIATALENNYSIKIARNDLAINENNYTIGNAGFLPTVTANFNRNYGIQSFEQVRTDGSSREDSGVKSNTLSYGARLDWTVFDGTRMFTSYEQLNDIKLQGQDNFKSQVEGLLFDIKTAFYQAALEKARLASLETNVSLSRDRLKIAKDKYELGKASKLEYLQAQVDLNTDITTRIQQSEILAIRKFELQRLMALDEDYVDFVLQYQVIPDSTINLQEVLINVEAQNPQLSAIKREQLIAKADEKLAKGNMLPTVDLFASYGHTNSATPGSPFLLENVSDDINYGLTASWTIFNGFNVQRERQNAKIRYESSAYAYKNQLLTIKTDVKNRYTSYKNSLLLLDLETENVEVAKENNEIAQERYRIGLSNPVELREAQLNLTNAELRYQNAAFAAKLAEIELKFLSGELSVNPE